MPHRDASAAPSSEPVAGRAFGPYRILQELGRGGMGEVLLAEQTTPIQRQVAIKVIKAGMDSAQVVARFEAERQALALMNHPAIARVLDAGTTPEGRPFFAMELVKGEAITGYCDRHRLGTRERLQLFLQVCDGVQHAHQRAIIHRDLKPTNILVTTQDDKPTPKIIDFGLAKAMAQPLTDRTLFTEAGQWVGTPEYMSPEQADMNGQDVDTRSDVYSLGVVLYELLCGSLPFDRRQLRDASLAEVQRHIREVDPPRPSTRVSTAGDATSALADKRRTDPPNLRRSLRGDMDWITMKALAKERSRRYGSVAELRADIDRHLRNEPVSASPPSRLYAARKFVRRHRAGVVAALVAVLALLVATAVSIRHARRAQVAEAQARREAASAKQVAEFLAGIFDGANPGYARDRQLTAREVLDAGAARLDADLASQPDVQARLQLIIGSVYARLGAYEPAIKLLERALAHAEREPRDPGVLTEVLSTLASAHEEQGRLDQALVLSERALELARGMADWPGMQAFALAARGRVLIGLARYSEAEADLQACLRLLDKDRDGESTAACLTNIANCRYYLGDYQGALDNYRQVLEIEKQLAARDGQAGEHYGAATTLHNTALVYTLLGRFDEARALETRALAIRENVFGTEHWHVALSLSAMAELELRAGKFDSAEALVRRALAIGSKQYEGDKVETAGDLELLARVLLAAGKPEAARQQVEAALAMQARLGSVGDDRAPRVTLGDCLRSLGDLDGAAQAYAQVVAQTASEAAADLITRFLAFAGQVRLALAKRDGAAADAAIAQARKLAARIWPSGHPDLAALEAELRAAPR